MSPIFHLKGHSLPSSAQSEFSKNIPKNFPLTAGEVYRDLVELAHEGISLVDESERFMFVNRQFAKNLGYKASDFAGKSLFDFTTNTTAARIRQETQKRKLGRKSRYETTFIHRNGSFKYFLLSASPIYDASRKYIASMGVMHDVTEQKLMAIRLERKMKQIHTLYRVYSHARLAKPLHAMLHGISRDIVHAFPFRQQVQAKLIIDDKIYNSAKKMAAPFAKKMQARIIIAGINRGMLLISYKKAADSPETIAPLKEEQELLDNVATIVSKHLYTREVLVRESEIQEANKRLAALNQLKDEFIATTSHELRSPLTSIRGYLSFLVEEESLSQMADPYREYLIRAYSMTDSLNVLINNILDVSRLDMGRFELQKRETDIIKLVSNILDSMAFQFHEKKLKQEFINDTGKEQLIFPFDSIRVSQVIRNILDNSIKFSKQGKKISVSIEARSNGISIYLADQGLGIPRSKLDDIFDKFMQVKSAKTKYKGGVGLGLFIAKRIIELHGGHILANTNHDGGTTISIHLPLRLN